MKKTAIILLVIFSLMVIGTIFIVWEVFKDVFVLVK